MNIGSETITNKKVFSNWEIVGNKTEGTVLKCIENTQKTTIKKAPYLLIPHKKHPMRDETALFLGGSFSSFYHHLLVVIHLDQKLEIKKSAMQSFYIKRARTGHLVLLGNLDSAKADEMQTFNWIQNNSLRLMPGRKIILALTATKGGAEILKQFQNCLDAILKQNLFTRPTCVKDLILQETLEFKQKYPIISEEIHYIEQDSNNRFYTFFVKADDLHAKATLMKALGACPIRQKGKLDVLHPYSIMTASIALGAMIGAIIGFSGNSVVVSTSLFLYGIANTLGLIISGAILGILAGTAIGALIGTLTMCYIIHRAKPTTPSSYLANNLSLSTNEKTPLISNLVHDAPAAMHETQANSVNAEETHQITHQNSEESVQIEEIDTSHHTLDLPSTKVDLNVPSIVQANGPQMFRPTSPHASKVIESIQVVQQESSAILTS